VVGVPVVWVVKCGDKTLVAGDRVEVFDSDSKAIQRAVDMASSSSSQRFPS